jgi:glycyl-tRNA synthetase beta chain
MTLSELLLELFSEEIPARMQKRAGEELLRLVCDGLKKADLEFYSATAYATPRRLALVVTGLPTKQPDVKDERKGPQTGAPEQAMNGFKNSLPEGTQIKERDLKGKSFYFAVIDKKGEATADLLKDVIDTALIAMATSWPKSMRWGKNTVRWARPLHSIACVLDGTIIPVELGPVTASDTSSGHRFLAPELFAIKDFADYKAKLENAKVMLDAAERCEKIRVEAEALARAEGLTLSDDPGLLDEVAGLVEWPVTLIGNIDDEFMAVPPEVLIAAMRGHQKYFSTLNSDGQLAAKFIFVSNMEADDGGKAIVAGNERVLRARLSDAKFFWDQDRKEGLESRLPKLVGVVFHAKLGSVLKKVERMTALAGSLSASIPGANLKTVERAAKLSKADLVTGMVGELPELQGLMGRYYALGSGEEVDVADAIADHYSPAGPNDNCPSKPASVAVALADKIDTLVGFWSIDEKPTGSKDPFALRRAALGVIRLIIENNMRLSLLDVFATAGGKDVASDLLSFFGDRLKVHLKEKGVRHDLIDAVFALGEDDLVLVLARVDALAEFLNCDDGANLLVAYTRAANILKIEEKKDGKSYTGNPDQALLEEAGEKALYRKLMDIGPKITASIVEEKYTEVMIELASARSEIDSFFDKVTVNSDHPKLRENRLNMLSYIRRALDEVADFSIIEG